MCSCSSIIIFLFISAELPISYHRNNALEGDFVTFRNLWYVYFSTITIVGSKLNSSHIEYCLLAKKL